MTKKRNTRPRTRIVRSLSELTEDEALCVRSTQIRERRHPDGRVETTLTLAFYSKRDAAKLLRMRDALKAVGAWPERT